MAANINAILWSSRNAAHLIYIMKSKSYEDAYKWCKK